MDFTMDLVRKGIDSGEDLVIEEKAWYLPLKVGATEIQILDCEVEVLMANVKSVNGKKV